MEDKTKLVEELKSLMRKSVVKFTYLKKDGEERVACGTLDMEVIPEEAHPVGDSDRKVSDDVIRYYDVEKNGWRSFAIQNLESINCVVI